MLVALVKEPFTFQVIRRVIGGWRGRLNKGEKSMSISTFYQLTTIIVWSGMLERRAQVDRKGVKRGRDSSNNIARCVCSDIELVTLRC